tara:strand:+ start:4879 stop:5058 length:180 start_codon:yes stop_codon:yes gene_type:complete
MKAFIIFYKDNFIPLFFTSINEAKIYSNMLRPNNLQIKEVEVSDYPDFSWYHLSQTSFE